MRIVIAPYALRDFLRALQNSNVKGCTITKEDNDLVVYLTKEDLDPIKKLYSAYSGKSI